MHADHHLTLRIDLHCHSNASDGTEPPAEVIRRAASARLDLVALTDHDTTAGYAEAAAAGSRLGVEVVLGCEVSCAHAGRSVHLLGYLFDPGEPALREEIDLIRTDRTRRAHAMVDKLHELGAPVDRDRVFELAAGGAVGRPHVARALVEAGVVPDVASAFTPDWIANGGRAYVDKRALPPARAVELVRGAGGVAVLAHPGAQKRGDALPDTLVEELAAAGLAGLEVDHPDHDDATRARLRDLATRLGLLATGSSDDHGSLTGHRLGTNLTDPVTWSALAALASRG